MLGEVRGPATCWGSAELVTFSLNELGYNTTAMPWLTLKPTTANQTPCLWQAEETLQ